MADLRRAVLGLAISLVIASSVALIIMSLSAFQSLALTQEAYYRQYRSEDIFARVKRAPAYLEEWVS